MKDKDVIEGNRLIAGFMGDITDNSKEWISTDKRLVGELKYHSSWDWLMPVVEKIEKEFYLNFQIEGNMSYITSRVVEVDDKPYLDQFDAILVEEKVKINSVCQAVVQFIQWYNTQTPSVK